jgi:hypothetical protein
VGEGFTDKDTRHCVNSLSILNDGPEEVDQIWRNSYTYYVEPEIKYSCLLKDVEPEISNLGLHLPEILGFQTDVHPSITCSFNAGLDDRLGIADLKG